MPIELEDRGKSLENEFFRRQEQELIAKMKEKMAVEHFEQTQMQCPHCDGKLVETDFEHIRIDVCDKCSGAWFDAGQLAQVVAKEDDSGWLSRFFK